MQTPFSEMIASATPVRDRSTGKASRPCSIDHLVIRRNAEEWRDIPTEDQIIHSVRGDLPDVIPLATDGIRYIGRLPGNSDFFIGHVTNLLKPERVLAAAKPKTTQKKERSVAIKTVIVALDDLFS